MKLDNKKRAILKALHDGTYPDVVPHDDVESFMTLQTYNLVISAATKGHNGPEYCCPRLTEEGIALFVDNPNLKNEFNWDRLISIVALIVAISSLIVSIVK